LAKRSSGPRIAHTQYVLELPRQESWVGEASS
jgi:hypothetical protein